MILLRDYALRFVGTPYKWGGDNPLEGFDCSGFVQWILRAAGMDPPGDQTAQALYDHFERDASHNVCGLGSLVFYGKSVTAITHVAFCLDAYRVIEAAGGDCLTLTREDAARKGACVRVAHIDHRKDRVSVLRPRGYAKIGSAA